MILSVLGLDKKKLLVPMAGFLCPSRRLDWLHIMLINGIIIIHLSERIEFNFVWELNTMEFSIRVNFYYFFVFIENESKCEWRTLTIIDTSFLKAMCHIHIEASMVTLLSYLRFPYFLPTSFFRFKAEQVIVGNRKTIICSVLNQKTNWWAESRETN